MQNYQSSRCRRIFNTKTKTLNPRKLKRKSQGRPCSFSGITYRTIVYKMTPDMNENMRYRISRLRGKMRSRIRPAMTPNNVAKDNIVFLKPSSSNSTVISKSENMTRFLYLLEISVLSNANRTKSTTATISTRNKPTMMTPIIKW